MCSSGCGFYASAETAGLCSCCFRKMRETAMSASGHGAAAMSGGAGAPASRSRLESLLDGPRFSGLPMQTDAAHGRVASNQCSWAATEFVRIGARLAAAAVAGDEPAFRAAYAGALARGSALRAGRGDARLTMGENVDNAGVRGAAMAPPDPTTGAAPPAALGAPRVAVLNAGRLEELRALSSFAPAGALALAQVDPCRPGVEVQPAAAFAADVAALPPRGFVLLCRNGQSLALLRAAGGAPPDTASADALLVLDSHCSVAGFASPARALEYAVGEASTPELTWVTGVCAEEGEEAGAYASGGK